MTVFFEKHAALLFGAIVMGIVALLHLLAGKLILTGDEPRYLFASVSAWIQGDFLLSQASWNGWLEDHHLGLQYEASRGVHSVLHSIFLSPVAAKFGLESARWVQLILVSLVAALYFKSATLGQRFSTAVWVLLYFITIPLLPYLKLIYPEAWLFLFFSIVVILSSTKNTTTVQKYIFLISLAILPFLHLRTAFAASIFGIYFACQEWNRRPRDLRNLTVMMLVMLTALLLFVWYQISLSGSIIGTAVSVYQPSLGILLDRLSAQTFGYRHGLFFNNPLALIGLAGLILGSMRKNPFLLTCFLSLVAYLLTFIWGVASESYSARFWVFVIPLFIFGSIHWVSDVKSPFKWVVLVVLAAVTLFNTALFVVWPNFFLENRDGSISYEYLYDHIAHFINFNLIAAADQYDGGLTVLNPQDNLKVLLMGCVVVVGLVGLGARLTISRYVCVAMLLAVLTIATRESIMIPMPSDQYVVDFGVDGLGRSFIHFKFKNNVVVHGMRFGRYLDHPTWGSDASAPRQLLINGLDPTGSGIPEQRVPGFPLVKFTKSENLSELTVISYSPEFVKKLNISSIDLF